MKRWKEEVAVVILTALDIEYEAIRAHLTDPTVRRHEAGTLFEVGGLSGASCRIAIAVTGPGNTAAAILAERAISMFRPQALLFVGIAGALADDLSLGDIIVATKIYQYDGGREEDEGFLARPCAWSASHELEQAARHVARTGSWKACLPAEGIDNVMVHFRPVAASEVILNSRTSPLAVQIHRHYNDAAAIEMESAGAARAGHLNHGLPMLTIRGISDKADGKKYEAAVAAWQPIAVARASEFATSLLKWVLTTDRAGSGRGGDRQPRLMTRVTALDLVIPGMKST